MTRPAPPAPVVRDAAGPPTCAELRERSGSAPVGTCRTKRALLTVGPQSPPLRVDGVTVDARQATLLRASSASGRRRNRARVSVRLSLTNGSDRPLSLPRSAIGLSITGPALRADAADVSADRLRLDRPIPPGERRVGIVRFEIAGDETETLGSRRRADLGIRFRTDRIGVIRLRPRILPRPPAPAPAPAPTRTPAVTQQ